MKLFKGLAGVCVALLLATPAFAATLPAATVAQLATAWNAAQPGDTISLACGTYAKPNLQGRRFAQPVVITSADPKCPAVLQGLIVANAGGVTFDGLELATYNAAGPVDPYYAFRLTNCAQISFTRNFVHGDPAVVPSKQVNGFYPSNCQGVDFTANTFKNMNAALNVQSVTGLHVKGNSFSQMAKGGLEIGGTQSIEIVDNFMTDFQTGANVHGDGIQIFTAGTKAASGNIVITGNLFTRGGGLPVQSIFLQDENGALPFFNVVIADNMTLGGEWNSITLIHAVGPALLFGNTSASWPGPDPVKVNPDGSFATTAFTAYIRLDKLQGASVLEVNDCAQQWIKDGTNAPVPAGNALCGAVNDNGAAAEAAWRSAHPAYLPAAA